MIRPAAPQDIPGLLELLDQVNELHALGRPDLFRRGTKYGPDELAALLADPTRPVFVWIDEDRGRILGHAFCLLREVPAGDRLMQPVKSLYIDDICVDAAARRRGIGEALCAHVRAYARALGCYNVTLNVWSCNPGARAFYERQGFLPQKITMEELL